MPPDEHRTIASDRGRQWIVADALIPGDTVAAVQGATPESQQVMQISMEAREPAWVSVTGEDGAPLLARTLQPNETRVLALAKGATLRTGNAGALDLRLNGKDLGPLGPAGKVREVEFRENTFRIRTPAVGHDSGASK